MKKLISVLLAVLLLLALAACGGSDAELSLATMDVQTYSHPTNGAELTLPADWKLLSETDEATIFAAADNSISFTILRELAGFSYYSAEGLAGLAEELAGGVLTEPETLQSEALYEPQGAVLATFSGELPDAGGPAVCEVVVFSPLPAVRYFTVAVAGSDAYQANANLLREVYASFALNKTEDEIYRQLAAANA